MAWLQPAQGRVGLKKKGRDMYLGLPFNIGVRHMIRWAYLPMYYLLDAQLVAFWACCHVILLQGTVFADNFGQRKPPAPRPPPSLAGS